jgi:SAM-dependent methyltransferase
MPDIAKDPADPALGGNVIGGDPNTYDPSLWSFLVTRFRPRTFLDVGCGEGHCVQYVSGLGLKCFGIDGLKSNVERAVAPITLHDLRTGPFLQLVDLVHCCEVVEHIEEAYLPFLLDTLSNGQVIAMTHALPGQDGWHHVNCQPDTYWIERLAARGYDLLLDETHEARHLDRPGGGWTYFQATGLIFQRRR